MARPTEGKKKITIKQYKAMKTLQQFAEEAAKQGYNTAREFNSTFLFMDFCYKSKLTPTNSLVHIKEDGSGCFIAF